MGHQVVVRDLLDEVWTPARLQRFFAGLPVAEWFNTSAPRVRSGEVRPEDLEPDHALALMVREPLLIRRPLMEKGGETRVGFEPEQVKAWLGLDMANDGDLETCPRFSTAKHVACGGQEAP
jgi:nitrogenase-associated protein